MGDKVLLLGSDGRTHALAERLIKEGCDVLVTPGNAWTEMNDLKADVDASDFEDIGSFCSENDIEYVLPCPEQAIVDGVREALEPFGVKALCPGEGAEELEGSKIAAREFMQDYLPLHIPEFWAFDSDDFARNAADALEQAKRLKGEVVVKADGLAAGKGVHVFTGKEGDLKKIERLLTPGDGSLMDLHGKSGKNILLEELLVGEEVSMHYLLDVNDGRCWGQPLIDAQDHKARFKGDFGPNTGGMGAYAPTAVMTPDITTWVDESIFWPTASGISRMGQSYSGVLYIALMVCGGKPYVIEYNVRFGDPETQPLMQLTENLWPALRATYEGGLQKAGLMRRKGHAFCVVLCNEGYPGSSSKGEEILIDQEGLFGLGVKLYHAGTKLVDGRVVTNGGRVCNLVAVGSDVKDARDRVYEAIENKLVQFKGMGYRTDIGHRLGL